jgi:hypothetical protein
VRVLAIAILFLPTFARADVPASQPAGGFRMEGDPQIETVFGDSAQYKKYVDDFYGFYGDMQKSRVDFSRNVQAVIASLQANQTARRCPADAVALAYARAFHAGQRFQALGKSLEADYVSIKDLDGLGETSGLTPDYRWRVARALKIYGEVLQDFHEMQASFQDQLAGEVKAHGCDVGQLVAKGDDLEKSGAPPTPAVVQAGQPAKPPDGKELAPLVTAATATFFVDNASCPIAMRVVLDGQLVGEVGSSSKAAFQSLVGRHDLCLIPSTSQQQCGEPGTLRSTYIHDGWSITMRCDQ